MKFLTLIILTLLLGTSNSSIDPFLVKPFDTDNNYSRRDKAHYVIEGDNENKTLLVFIGGSYSNPKHYARICKHAATIGLDVISLSYRNQVAAAPLGKQDDPLVFDHYRQEICFGNPVSVAVEVDELNPIKTRLEKLLTYLTQNHTEANWGQYLTASNTLQWDKIVFAGHSQGAGHAAYLGKKEKVKRVVMFSGPNDYSTYSQAPGNWLNKTGKTPIKDYYSLLHVNDNIVPFEHQVANTQALGLIKENQLPFLVGDDEVLKGNALSIDFNGLSAHNVRIGRNPKLPKIWEYMFIGN